MRLLDLQTGRHALIDDEDWPAVSHLTIYEGGHGYAYYSIWENGKSRPATVHGLLMQPPKGAHVDHINGDKLDNRRANLRVVTPQRNQVNRKHLNKNNSSGVRGVTKRHNRWIAQITVHGKNHYLGMFQTLDDAAYARRSAELVFFGELCP